MMLKRTSLMLASAAVAVAIPATLALSQQQSGGAGSQQQSDRHQQQQQDRPGQLNGQRQQSPEQSKEMAQKWIEHCASANQFEIETAKLAMERFGGGQAQPGQTPGQRPGQGQQGQQDPSQRPGQGDGMGQDPAARPGQQSDPSQRAGQAQPAGGQMPGMQGEQKQKLLEAAQMIQRDHQQALDSLRQKAEQAGVQISQTPELDPVHKAKLDMLREKQGEEFARAWVFGNMGGHTHAILEYTWASQNGPSPEIQAYARETLPKLQQHAQMIAPIAYQLAGVQEARTAGERMGEDPPKQPGQQPGQGSGSGQRPPGGSGSGGGSDRPDGA